MRFFAVTPERRLILHRYYSPASHALRVKFERLALGKRRSQLESNVTEESASHPTSAFEIGMQSATSEQKS